MDENLELLEYIYKNAEMGAFSLTTLIDLLNGKENKIKKTVEEEIKGYLTEMKKSKLSELTLVEASDLIKRKNGGK